MDGVATAAASPAAPERKQRRKKSPPLGTADLVFRAVSASTDRKGMSFVALKKELATQGYDVDNNTIYIKRAVKFLVSKGALLQTKGSGATGSYKANKNAEKLKSVKTKAAKKPKGATTEKAGKPVAAKKTSVQKASKSSMKEEEA